MLKRAIENEEVKCRAIFCGCSDAVLAFLLVDSTTAFLHGLQGAPLYASRDVPRPRTFLPKDPGDEFDNDAMASKSDNDVMKQEN